MWVCHKCKFIGIKVQAHAHEITTGHEIERLDEKTSDAIREEWRRVGDPRAEST